MAVTQTLVASRGDAWILSDSAYVVNGWEKGKLFQHDQHQDLWKMAWGAAEGRQVVVRKVKAHCT